MPLRAPQGQTASRSPHTHQNLTCSQHGSTAISPSSQPGGAKVTNTWNRLVFASELAGRKMPPLMCFRSTASGPRTTKV